MFMAVTGLMLTMLIVDIAIITVWAIRSPWYKYIEGRSVMGLLASFVPILGLAIISRIAGYDFPFREPLYAVTYTLLLGALLGIGATILRAQARDRGHDGTTPQD